VNDRDLLAMPRRVILDGLELGRMSAATRPSTALGA
jgi:hypothetical protein